jgi:hypothetical protein
MVDSDGTLKRKREDKSRPIKRLRSSQQLTVSRGVISVTPPGDDRVAQQFSPRPSPPTSEERTKKGAASEIPADGSIIAETEYGDDEHIAGTFSPSGVGMRSTGGPLENRDYESVIAETEYGDGRLSTGRLSPCSSAAWRTKARCSRRSACPATLCTRRGMRAAHP